jgi:chorismate mutase
VDDPTVEDYRARISAADGDILAAVNRRVALVAELHAHKRRNGHPLFDGNREDAVVRLAQERNQGPLSDRGVADLYRFLIPLCTAEAARIGEEAAPA